MDPTTKDDWLAVSGSRLDEARHIHNANPVSVGSAYLSGYSVECALKAALTLKKIKIPKGSSGHDLKNLVRKLNIPIRNANESAWFIDEWSVDWRYFQSENDLPREVQECIIAAGKIQRYLEKFIARLERR